MPSSDLRRKNAWWQHNQLNQHNQLDLAQSTVAIFISGRRLKNAAMPHCAVPMNETCL